MTVNSFALYVVEAYEHKRKKNERYSLRSYAKFLGIDHSLLSKFMRGEVSLSRKSLLESLRRLNAPIDLLKKAETSFDPLNPYEEISDDEFEIISHWSHYAILELMTVPGFSLSVESIEEKLGLKREAAEFAINRLEKLSFIRRRKAGYVLTRGNTSSYPTTRTSKAKIKSQQDLLALSCESLLSDTVEVRDHSSVILAVNRVCLPEVKSIISEARRRLTKLIQKDKEFTDIYCLQISFFPLREKGNVTSKE